MDQGLPRLLIVALLAMVATADAAAETWRVYRNQEQRFSVDLPGDAGAVKTVDGKTPQGLGYWILEGAPPALSAEVAITVRRLSQESARVRNEEGTFHRYVDQRRAELRPQGLSLNADDDRLVCGDPAFPFQIWRPEDRDHPIAAGMQVYAAGRIFTLTVASPAPALRDRLLKSFRSMPCEGYTYYPTGDDFRHRLMSDALGFSLIAPGKPEMVSQVPCDGCTRMVMFADRSRQSSTNGYTFDYVRRRPGVDPDDPEAWLDAWMQRQNDSQVMTEVEARNRLCGAPAVRYARRGRSGGGGVRLLAVARGDTLFELQSGEPWQPDLHPDERRYFDAFELLPCPR